MIDDETPGVVVVESDGTTLVTQCGNPACAVPGPGDDYRLRLTHQPTAPVTVRIVSDGQSDVTNFPIQAVGGQVALQQFSGGLTISGTTVTRTGEAAFGNFADEGFKAGQLIRIVAGASSGDFTIASVSGDGQTLTLTTPVPTGGSYTGAIIDRLVSKGVYTGQISYDASNGTLTRVDGTSWLDDGFLEGQLIQVSGFVGTFKIQSIAGTSSSKLDVLTIEKGATVPVLPGTGTAQLTVTQWAAVVTFDSTNWYQPVDVKFAADPFFDPGVSGHENTQSFSKRPHLLSDIRGPLEVEGGTTGADRSLAARDHAPRRAEHAAVQDRPAAARVAPGRHAQHLRRLEPGGPDRLPLGDLADRLQLGRPARLPVDADRCRSASRRSSPAGSATARSASTRTATSRPTRRRARSRC